SKVGEPTLAYAVKDTNKETITYENNLIRPSEGKALGEKGFRHYMTGFTGGAGLTYPIGSRALSLELRYERNNGISQLLLLNSNINNFNLMLSFGF
ncbi:hypothetical protein, partial [Pontibacter silvestris]